MIGDIPYRFTVQPLSADEGGGYLVEFPDLPGCMADGETIDEAITNARDAMACWLQAMRDAGRPTPKPSRDALIVNLKAAEALGLTIPPLVLLGADEVIW
jgi:predicted RNase H-like HicB family nuclease